MVTSIGSNLTPRRAGARRWLVIASLILHAGVIGTYVVLGMMRIERLAPEKTRIRVASLPKIDPGGASEKPGRKPDEPVRRDATVKPPPLVQPPDHPPTIHITPVPTDTPASTGGGDPNDNRPPGDGGWVKGPPSDKPPGCPPGVECTGGDPPTTTVKKDTTTAPTNVAPTVINSLRTDGDPQIHPPDTAQTAMIRDGKTKVFGIVQLCLDTTGRISKTKLLKSTGYPGYDDALLSGVRTWRYEPHRVNGTAVPVCSTVHFNYSIR